MKYRAYLNTGTGNQKEFMASTPEMLRKFIEAYWLKSELRDNTWKQMLESGVAIGCHYGAIHVEIKES